MSDSDFERQLGFLDATSIGLGTMIGGGIFILPSIAAAQAGPASAISFAIAGVVSLLSALSHAEVATDMQNTEGGATSTSVARWDRCSGASSAGGCGSG